jgi:hypothetical protein
MMKTFTTFTILDIHIAVSVAVILAVTTMTSSIPTLNAFSLSRHFYSHHGHIILTSPSSSISTTTTYTSRNSLLLASSDNIPVDTNGNINAIMAETGGEGNGKIKEALKKYRGPSISVEVSVKVTETNNHKDNAKENKENMYEALNSLSNMDMEILSQELRKAKASSIFTSDLNVVNELANEQKTAFGNFPGPCPIIYNGDVNFWMDAVEKGAAAVVIDSMTLVGSGDNDNNVYDSIVKNDDHNQVDIICRVENIDQVQNVLDKGIHYAFMIPSSHVDIQTLKDMLKVIPKESVIIYSLQAMQKNNSEITLGKEAMSLSSNSDTGNDTIYSKVSGLLLENACVGDEEDIKYTSFAVSSLTKKASSTFAMTGLTGSTNGHFGTMSDNASIDNTKWRRTMKD